MTTLPALYIPHGGGPCFFMDDPHAMWTGLADYLRAIPASLPEKPKAILKNLPESCFISRGPSSEEGVKLRLGSFLGIDK